MNTIIKISLLVSILVFLFVKSYVPLMYETVEEKKVSSVKYNLSPAENISSIKFELRQNYPNPFNESTEIELSVPKESNVKLTVVDLLGNEIRTLINENLSPGTYNTSFDGKNLQTGVYFYKLVSDNCEKIRKMILIKEI